MLEDRLLIWRLKSGSRDAFRRIYEKYIDDLLTLATNLLSDGAAAEDVVQDVFISFVQAVEKFHLTGSLKSYLATCTANRARDYLRKRHRQQAAPLDEAEQVTADVSGPVQLAVRSEELQRLGQAMTELPYEQREAIVLRLNADLKFRQIAKLQKVSVKTVLSRYRYGLDKLQSILEGEVQKWDR
ncbi:MAG TPA: sigma-70 family RNA polymerase sigma factor [Sedimentisphaerales bacterium]|nr:sigma-70 family RNA polymerase sigma factor [Sedimentisphaerales bacterium]